MLPFGVRVGPATLRESTCELVRLTGAEVVLRPTQDGADVAMFDLAPNDVAGGTADGGTVVPTSAAPFRVRFDRVNGS